MLAAISLTGTYWFTKEVISHKEVSLAMCDERTSHTVSASHFFSIFIHLLPTVTEDLLGRQFLLGVAVEVFQVCPLLSCVLVFF